MMIISYRYRNHYDTGIVINMIISYTGIVIMIISYRYRNHNHDYII